MKPIAAKAFKNNPTINDVKECLFMMRIRDRFLLGAIDCFINTDNKDYYQLVITSELALYDLENYVKSLSEKGKFIDEEEFKNILAQVAIAIETLHRDLYICHIDLKPANILIFADIKVKLSDFGFLKEIDKSSISISKCGTPIFTAPEVLGVIKGRILPFVTDIYSLGMTACWMVNLETPDIFEIHEKKIKFPDQYS